MKLSLLASRAWWKAAALRGVYTAVAIAVPYFGGALLADVPWLTIASAAALGFLASLLTSLAGLPETVGTDLPWWLAAVERVVKTFAQSLGAGFVGATLLTDVAWSTVLQAAVISALISLLRLILATLPNDPTPQAAFAELVIEENHTSREVAVDGVSIHDAPARAPGANSSFEAGDGRITQN